MIVRDTPIIYVLLAHVYTLKLFSHMIVYQISLMAPSTLHKVSCDKDLSQIFISQKHSTSLSFDIYGYWWPKFIKVNFAYDSGRFFL